MVLISHELPGVILKPIQNWHEWMVEIGFFHIFLDQQADADANSKNEPPRMDEVIEERCGRSRFQPSITSQNVETVTPSTQLIISDEYCSGYRNTSVIRLET
jgi:hypothetical protein